MKHFLFFIFLPVLMLGQSQIGLDIGGINNGDQSGYSVSMSADGSIVALGAINYDNPGSNSGQVRVFKNQSGTWTQVGQDINGEASGDLSGFSISLSSDGSIVAIGATNNSGGSSYAGQVRIYQNQSGTWTKIGQDIDGTAPYNLSGWSVSLSSDGSIVAIGAIGYNGDGQFYGSTRVFEFNGTSWTQKGQVITGEANFDFSGWSVSLSSDGSILALGATYNDNQTGNVRIFGFDGSSSTWVQIGNNIKGENPGDQFGQKVNLSSDGSLIAISSTYYNTNSGFVQIYQNQSGNWTKLGNDINGEVANEQSGQGIGLSSDGTIVAIGAYGNGTNGASSGQVRVYKYLEGNWTQMGSSINGSAANDWSGWSVALSSDGSKVAIGAPNNDNNGNNNSGQVRIFDLSAVLSTQDLVTNNYAVYPNPTSDYINVQLKNNSVFEKATIYSISGQFIKTSSSKTIDVSDLFSGIYLVEVETNQGKSVQKIVKI